MSYGRGEYMFSVDGSRCSFCHDQDRQVHRWPACRRVPRFSFVDEAGRVYWICRSESTRINYQFGRFEPR